MRLGHVELVASGPNPPAGAPDLDYVTLLVVDEPLWLDLGLQGPGQLREERPELLVSPVLASPRESARLVDHGLRMEEAEDAGDIAPRKRRIRPLQPPRYPASCCCSFRWSIRPAASVAPNA